jgi:prepilin-type processing-associated H-X9-DG protein
VWPRVSDRRVFVGSLGGLILLAWLSLWLWQGSPYGRYLSHGENEEVGLGSQYLQVALLFVAGWTLMTIAMMLPTSLPLVALFHSFVRRRPRQLQLVALLVAGYLGVWTLFAAVVHAADVVIHQVVGNVAWLDGHAWIISAGTILLAGVYQFTPLKHRCLDKCRSPLSFIMEHWRGDSERAQALRLGMHHGAFCIGCCWSLMLLMFAVGVGNIGWMLVLGAVMAVEKNLSWGRRLTAPLGTALVAWGLVLFVLGAPGPGGVH